MLIHFTRKFAKQYDKADLKIKNAFQSRLKLFREDSFNPLLNNHSLRGEYLGYRSINVTGDLRAIFKIVGDETTFVIIDSHSNLYG